MRLFERDARCGGVIRTDRAGGFVIDPGPDTLLARKPAALALCRDLGLESSLVAPTSCRTTYVVREGALRPLPETSAFGLPTDWKVLATTRAFSWRGKLRKTQACDASRRLDAAGGVRAITSLDRGARILRHLALGPV